MNRCDVEICGFLDVKPARNRYITQKMKKKVLISSKVWKRYWCSVMKLESGRIKVQFDNKLGYSSNSSALKDNEKNNFVIIPPTAVVHRIYSKTKKFAFGISAATDKKLLLSLSGNSETEAQRWMTNIRHLLKPRTYSCAEKSYDVSIIDNKHSKAAGLTGLHGDLFTDKVAIFIKDIYTGEIVRSFEWKEFGQFHLMTAGRPEDVKRICVMHTTKEFCCGIGELHMFCLDANKLLQDLVTQGRGAKRRQSALSFDNENFQSSDQCNKVAVPQKRKCNALTCFVRESNSHEELDASFASGIYEEIVDDECSSMPRMVTSNINNDANDILCFDNLQMTPPPLPPRWAKKTECMDKFSDTDAEKYSEIKILEEDSERRLSSTGVYKRTIALIESTNYVPMSPQWKNVKILRHGELDASFASGIYEEIVDDVCSSMPRTVTSNTNNDANDILCSDNLQMTPPPLPPRWTKKTECLDKYSHEELDASFASGIYEEIVDDVCSSMPRTVTSNTNNDANDILCYDNPIYNNIIIQMTPPPLSPRWTTKTEWLDKFSDTDAEQYSEIKILEEDSERRLSSTGVYERIIALTESSDYVPMSPQWKNINILRYSMENAYENDYLMMR